MKYSDYHLSAHQFFRIRHTELNAIYYVMALRSFIVSLVGLFVPIYLWNLGYGLERIIWIYIFVYVSEALLEYPVAMLLSKFGPKHLIAASMPFLVLHFWMLWTIPKFGWSDILIGISGGFAVALFWQAYHWDFSKSKHSHSATAEVSKSNIIMSIVGAMAPLIGGFVATRFGIGYDYAFVVVALMLIVFPLLRANEPHIPKRIDFKKVQIKKVYRHLISYGALGAQSLVGLVAWPIIAFLIVGSYQNVGLATSAAILVSISITYYVGKKADEKKNQNHYVKAGGLLMGMVYFIKVIASTFLHVLTLNLASDVASSIFNTPFVSEYYLHADEESRSEYVMLMEFSIDVARIMVLFLLLFFTFFFTDKAVLIIGLVIAGIASLFIGVMPPANCEVQLKNKNIKLMPRPVKHGIH